LPVYLATFAPELMAYFCPERWGTFVGISIKFIDSCGYPNLGIPVMVSFEDIVEFFFEDFHDHQLLFLNQFRAQLIQVFIVFIRTRLDGLVDGGQSGIYSFQSGLYFILLYTKIS
jgi:hypothetical protein